LRANLRLAPSVAYPATRAKVTLGLPGLVGVVSDRTWSGSLGTCESTPTCEYNGTLGNVRKWKLSLS